MSVQESVSRRTPSGALYRSYSERVARGWVRPLRERGYNLPVAAKRIIEQTAADYGLTIERLLTKIQGSRASQKRRLLAEARFDLMHRLRHAPRAAGLGPYSLPHIAAMIGLEDHTTVLSGLRRWAEIQAEREA